MTQFIRTLNIASKGLGGTSAPTLILTFDDQPMKGIYQDYFPIAWKISTFPTKGNHAMRVTYKNQLTFINPQIENDKIVTASSWVNIGVGQKTSLEDDSGEKVFTPPTSGAGSKLIKAINSTSTPQTISVGFDNGGSPPPSMLVFENVGSKYNVTAQFTPTLTAYISEDYQESAIIRGAIETPYIWRMNLADLAENTNWTLDRDGGSGDYTINPA